MSGFLNQNKKTLLPLGVLAPVTFEIYLSPPNESCFTAGSFTSSQVLLSYTLNNPYLEYVQVSMGTNVSIPPVIQFKRFVLIACLLLVLEF